MRFKQFLQRFQVEYLTKALKDTFTRFPLSVICCAAGAGLSMFAAHDLKFLSDEYMSRTLLFLANGLVFFTAARLYAEGAGLPRARQGAIAFCGGALLLAIAYVPDHFTAMHLFVTAALSLSMLFAPFIGRNSTEDSVWYYNYLNGVSFAIAVVSSVILCLGLCAVYGSMDYLLYDMKLSKTVYADIWIFGSTFFGPVMFMHQLSRQFDFPPEDCRPPKGVWFIANYIVVPLVLIYVWVLYAYLGKIIATLELPKGNLAYMVTGFGALGVAARLAVFPMRGNGTKLLQQFYKFFFYILIVPVALLAVGLYTRISQYGVTEERYAIGVCLVWLVGLTLWNLAKPKLSHIKHVPMALAFLFIVAAAGPWGAVSVSTQSQAGRLEALLRKAGVIHDDGTIAKAAQNVPFEVRKDISGILDYMFDGKRKAIARWLAPFHDEIAKKYKAQGMTYEWKECPERTFSRCWQDYDLPQHVMEAWGMDYVGRWQSEENASGEYKSFTTAYGQPYNNNAIMKVAPYAYVLMLSPNLYMNGNNWYVDHVLQEDARIPLKVKASMTEKGVLTVELGDRKAIFNVQPVADTLEKAHVQVIPDSMLDQLTVKPEEGAFAAELHISELHGRLTHDGTFKIEGGSMLLLFTP